MYFKPGRAAAFFWGAETVPPTHASAVNNQIKNLFSLLDSVYSQLLYVLREFSFYAKPFYPG